MNIKNYVLIDVLDKDKKDQTGIKSGFLYWWIQFGKYLASAIVTFMIPLIVVFEVLLTKEFGYFIILTLALIATFFFKPRFKAANSNSLGKIDFLASILFIALTLVLVVRLINLLLYSILYRTL